MGFVIEDPRNGTTARVNDEGNLNTRAITHSLQHHHSRNDGQVYQVIGDATVTAGTNTVLHITNDSDTKWLIGTFIRMQSVDLAGGTAPPSANTYFQMGFGTTWSSGGIEVFPTNMNRTSGNEPSITAYDGLPTVTGTFTEIDRYYPDSDADQVTFNKAGSLILGKNDTLEIRLVTDNTSGTAYARVTFVMLPPEE